MRPLSTIYRMASQRDLFAIYEAFELRARLGWPVVVAERDGKIIGFLGTQERKDMVVAGPLEVNLKNKGIVVFRLIEAYERLLQSLGLSAYWFFVSQKDDEKWSNQVKDIGIYTKIGETDGNVWYKRTLRGGENGRKDNGTSTLGKH